MCGGAGNHGERPRGAGARAAPGSRTTPSLREARVPEPLPFVALVRGYEWERSQSYALAPVPARERAPEFPLNSAL